MGKVNARTDERHAIDAQNRQNFGPEIDYDDHRVQVDPSILNFLILFPTQRISPHLQSIRAAAQNGFQTAGEPNNDSRNEDDFHDFGERERKCQVDNSI